MQNRVKTTLSLDKDIIKVIKLVALNKGITQTKIINEYLKRGLINEPEINKKSKIPDYLIANKNRKPDHEKHEKMAGFIKNVEPFNAVELIKEARSE